MFDHDVDPLSVRDLAHFFRDFLTVVIDHVIGSQGAGLDHFLLVARGRNDSGPKQLRHLDGSDSHS